MQTIHDERNRLLRRQFLRQSVAGSVALSALLNADSAFAVATAQPTPHFAPKAKRVIYLFQSGGPSQLELMDYKPKLPSLHGTELPDSIRQGQRVTGMTSGQKSFPVAAPKFRFAQYGQSGAWFSELLPFTAEISDQLCIVRSMHTEAINHDPAITFIQSGSQQPGRPSMGAWLST